MSARAVLVIVAHVLAAALAAAPAAAEPLRPGGYRIFLEAEPAYTLRPVVTAADIAGARGGTDDSADINRWQLVLIGYRPAGPVFQLLNSSTRLCLQPVRLDSLTYSVGQNVCGVADTGLWYVSETNGNRRLSLASDPSQTLYGDTASTSPVALLGRVGDEPRARWIFRHL
ncbi:hypothetical protein ACWDUL_22585 [Nocardia niigatensis]|uniref:hypothetical protein n=1 Tax=Nocardia niigatensis TaxID=209249 RepID=UPI0003138BD2|nr:hypothetical protein [Nocardia niigatensis]